MPNTCQSASLCLLSQSVAGLRVQHCRSCTDLARFMKSLMAVAVAMYAFVWIYTRPYDGGRRREWTYSLSPPSLMSTDQLLNTN